MDFLIKTGSPESQKNECIVVLVYEKIELSESGKKLDKASGGYITKILKRDGFESELGKILVLYDVPNLKSEKVILLGCGDKKVFSEQKFIKALKTLSSVIDEKKLKDLAFFVDDINLKRTSDWKVRQTIIHLCDALYRFEQFKSSKNKLAIKKITLVVEQKDAKKCEEALKQGTVISTSMDYMKDLANIPANICNPEYMGNEAKKLGKKYSSLKVNILNQKQIEKLKMGTMLAVSKGSDNPPVFITMEYNGGSKKDKPVVLVGKGVTFDTGGYSLKNPSFMIGMKYDMCGAATVLSVMNAVAALKLPINVVGIAPCVENMVSGKATRPDDIVTSMSGKTVEILNTDAEGRLILCDALTYAERYEPKAVIDIATLTGAVIIALGRQVSAVLSNHQPLARKLVEMGDVAQDKCWELPVWEDEYQELLSSPFADLANIGAGGEAGTITAARFLANFTEKYNWAHLDVAGTASEFSGRKKGARGRPVNLLVHYLLDEAGIL